MPMIYDVCSTFLSVSLFTANKVKIASLGGIEAIIKAMSTHKDISIVQEKACSALWSLAVNDGTLFVSYFTSNNRPFISRFILLFVSVFFSFIMLPFFFPSSCVIYSLFCHQVFSLQSYVIYA
jgi:hypothetical protein